MEEAQNNNQLKELLERYSMGLADKTLGLPQQMLLLDLFVQDRLLADPNARKAPSESDMLKYAFLGWYIYQNIGADTDALK